ncbi:MAG: phosphoribulokinase [Candidatus Sedimenticola sp. (ex Thyasira tokunagai)]
MSRKHPIIAVTGSSGAGTSTVKGALEHIFDRVGAKAAFIEGDSFHRYDRKGMKKALTKAKETGGNLSHFGPEGNIFDKQYELFKSYGETGTGMHRHYIHDETEAVLYNGKPGTFTEWEPLPVASDLLFYEGLHGGVVSDGINMADQVDLLIGVAPTINLEWIQKINRDTSERGYEPEVVMDTIHRRMYDYMHYILPQFENTHINFQRIPIVDTSNPFMVRDIPTAEQSLVLIHFLKDSPSVEQRLQLKGLIEGSFITGFNTLVIPGGKMMYAMELILTERILEVMKLRGHLEG